MLVSLLSLKVVPELSDQNWGKLRCISDLSYSYSIQDDTYPWQTSSHVSFVQGNNYTFVIDTQRYLSLF